MKKLKFLLTSLSLLLATTWGVAANVIVPVAPTNGQHVVTIGTSVVTLTNVPAGRYMVNISNYSSVIVYCNDDGLAPTTSNYEYQIAQGQTWSHELALLPSSIQCIAGSSTTVSVAFYQMT